MSENGLFRSFVLSFLLVFLILNVGFVSASVYLSTTVDFNVSRTVYVDSDDNLTKDFDVVGSVDGEVSDLSNLSGVRQNLTYSSSELGKRLRLTTKDSCDVNASSLVIRGNQSQTLVDKRGVSCVEDRETVFVPNSNNGEGVVACPRVYNNSGFSSNCSGLLNFSSPSSFPVSEDNVTLSLEDGFYAVEGINGSIVRVADGVSSSDADDDSTLSTSDDSGSGGGRSACYRDWECSSWSSCQPGGVQYRECYDVNKCEEKNVEIMTGSKPSENRSCDYTPTCTDGIKNGNETGVDCGGSDCESCNEEKDDVLECEIDSDCSNGYYCSEEGECLVNESTSGVIGVQGNTPVSREPLPSFGLPVFIPVFLIIVVLVSVLLLSYIKFKKESPRVWECSVCDSVFDNRRGYMKHREYHSGSERDVEVDHLNKVYSDSVHVPGKSFDYDIENLRKAGFNVKGVMFFDDKVDKVIEDDRSETIELSDLNDDFEKVEESVSGWGSVFLSIKYKKLFKKLKDSILDFVFVEEDDSEEEGEDIVDRIKEVHDR